MTRYKHKGVVAFGIGFERWTEAEELSNGQHAFQLYRFCDRLHVRIALWRWSFHLHPRLSRWRTEHEQAEIAAHAWEKYQNITRHRIL